MRFYPAMRAHMGNWHYYIVRMKMREIAQEVHLAHEIYEDQTLSDAVQRVLGEPRVKKDIVGYLSRRPDRFFSSIVVAAMEGSPSWYPVEMDPTVVPEMFAQSKTLQDSFGLLYFGDEPKYYALDGQHRVAAIKMLVDGISNMNPPDGFHDDLLSVIVLLREEHDVPDAEWLRRYRRLFSSLNRYAKPTDRDTNIIMDEDDLFAILTRRLITDHEFFQAPGKDRDSFRVQTKGKALRRNAVQFTTLQALYATNQHLLTTNQREILGWSTTSGSGKIDKQIRPDEEFIDACYDELCDYWNAVLKALPDLRRAPIEMRQHNRDPDDDVSCDHLLFFPIGQELLGRIVRSLLNSSFPETGRADVDAMARELWPLKCLSWELHDLPWRHLLLVRTRTGSWSIRSEQRTPAVKVAYKILRWLVGLDCRDDDDYSIALREEWEQMLLFGPESVVPTDTLWNEIVVLRQRILNHYGRSYGQG